MDHGDHAIRKKAYAAHYNTANLATFQPELQDLAVALISVRFPLNFSGLCMLTVSPIGSRFSGLIYCTSSGD